MDNKLHSMNINGAGTYPGGEFDNVSISGNGKIHGDIKCNTFDVSGNGKIIGTINTGEISISGNGKVEGNINAESLDVTGSLKCLKSINSDKVKISGVTKIEEKLQSHTIDIKGVLKVLSDIEAEEVNMDGAITCDGFLNCENLKVNIQGISRISEIGASKVNIKYQRKIFHSILNIFMPNKFNRLTVENIEGDDITLENCDVKVIRGKNIKIGQNCNIDTIEYSENIEVDEKSNVVNINKI